MLAFFVGFSLETFPRLSSASAQFENPLPVKLKMADSAQLESQ